MSLLGSARASSWRLVWRVVLLLLTAFPQIGHAEVSPEGTLKRYMQLRLSQAPWQEYSKLITWRDEPSWDCYWVADTFKLGSARNLAGVVVIPTSIRRIGLLCGDFLFEERSTLVTVNFQLVRRPNGWLIDAPVPEYPDVGAKYIVKTFEARANATEEGPTQRAGYRTAALRIRNALRRNGSAP